MTSGTRAEYALRETILKLLTDEETAKVSTAEAAPRLAEGAEYLDLERLGDGVRRADGVVIPIGRVVTRASVQPATWSTILGELAKTFH